MKKNLITILISLGIIFGTSCNKETFENEIDLNNDGKTEAVFSRYSPNGFILYSPKSNFDIDTVYNFGNIKPLMYGFSDMNNDNYPDLWLYRNGENGDVRYNVFSKEGKLLGEEEKKGEDY